MRDPDLVFKAQLAATELERAWYRWRVLHGLEMDPMPTVSSYVGYSLEEPWGEPRVVFGLSADDAKQLAVFLDEHEYTVPEGAEAPSAEGRDLDAADDRQGGAPPVPAQVPTAFAEPAASVRHPVSRPYVDRQAATAASTASADQRSRPKADDLVDPQIPEPRRSRGTRLFDDSADDQDGPVFRQIAAAAQQAAAARERAAEAPQEQSAKDQSAKDQSAKEQPAKDQPAKDQSAKDQPANEQSAKDQPAKELSAKEQSATGQASKQQAPKEQDAKEQAPKQQDAKGQAPKQQDAKGQAPKQQDPNGGGSKDRARNDQGSKGQGSKGQGPGVGTGRDQAPSGQPGQGQAGQGQAGQGQAGQGGRATPAAAPQAERNGKSPAQPSHTAKGAQPAPASASAQGAQVPEQPKQQDGLPGVSQPGSDAVKPRPDQQAKQTGQAKDGQHSEPVRDSETVRIQAFERLVGKPSVRPASGGGPLARAASAARMEAEARIMAARQQGRDGDELGDRDEPAEPDELGEQDQQAEGSVGTGFGDEPQSGSQPSAAKRNRMTLGYPIAKLPRTTKQPGTVPGT